MKEELVFERSEEWFLQRKAGITVKEILQQPRLWETLADNLEARKEEIVQFMQQVLSVKDLRIVFAGAGSSAFIGESMQKLLMRDLKIKSEAVHTTEIVCSPDITLYDVPTLLVSYARSGDSPESVASLRYARKKIKNLYNLVIVCNQHSSLADYAAEESGTLVLNMPQEACDKGFAMTSSVSCMALATFCAFNYSNLCNCTQLVRKLAQSIKQNMPRFDKAARLIAAKDYNRVVYLGSGAMYGLAREGAVKSLELTNGYVNATFDTPTGFRHGPKTVLTQQTLSVHFLSPNKFNLRYDTDVAKELISEKHNI
ncbi:MAG: SIS domain-containing protein, partial [Oscillospiraceae bacterium]